MGNGVLHAVGGYFFIFNLTNVIEIYVPQDISELFRAHPSET